MDFPDFSDYGPGMAPAPPKIDDPRLARLYQGASLCVMCGFCVPHCPTYAQSLDEAESPRGRITLMKGLATGDLPLDDAGLAHLDHCLGCRACEFVCPSQVPYGQLIDTVREVTEPQRPTTLAQRKARQLAFATVASRRRLRSAMALLRLYQRSGVQRAVRGSGVLRLLDLERLESQLPKLPPAPRWQPVYPARGTQRGAVALFTGCLSETFDRTALEAVIQVLTTTGFAVHVSDQQQCCGALHQHNGEPHEALRLARANLDAFAALPEPVDAIIDIVSGCGAQLHDYAGLDWPDEADRARAAAFSAQVRDISRFLVESEALKGHTLRPLDGAVAIHDPCSLTWVLREPHFPHQLLRAIPGIELAPLPNNAHCCGAGGAHLLTHPEQAARLRASKLEPLMAQPPAWLATSNTGCALHLAAGLREAGLPTEVVHPITLIARQLESRTESP